MLNFLFPPLCLQCREQVGEAGGLCARCWSAINFIEGPACARCGLPFDIPIFGETNCAACHAEPPSFDKARAIMRYDEASRDAILTLKHADRLDLVPTFARWLERVGSNMLAECDLIVPVPLHPLRLWTRRYNQSAELARSLSRLSRKPYAPETLERVRRTPSQGEMHSAVARRRNVAGAFRVNVKSKLDGISVLLVDDVLTTGATADSCARALKRSGARAVFVLALARVVRPT